MGTTEDAINAILLKLNALGFSTRHEGDGQSISFIATHRLHGHFFACNSSVGNEYETVCILAEMCGLEPIDGAADQSVSTADVPYGTTLVRSKRRDRGTGEASPEAP